MCWSWEELCYLTGLAGRLRIMVLPEDAAEARIVLEKLGQA